MEVTINYNGQAVAVELRNSETCMEVVMGRVRHFKNCQHGMQNLPSGAL